MTEAGKNLWRLLRRKQFAGFRFRRQAPIGPYVVDFFCPAAKLIIELDGGQHADRIEHDQRRTDYLTRAGYRVLRVWNNELNENEQGVLTIIGQALGLDETHHAQTH
ncbi:endonuclease domain-containing protein [Dongia sp.]|uniref:endonuclease domain-containing protein n=1 Tax=Dongia sp. TaxID=1977262 RepID=UPI0035B19BB2